MDHAPESKVHELRLDLTFSDKMRRKAWNRRCHREDRTEGQEKQVGRTEAKYCYRKTPLQALLDSKYVGQAKMLDRTLTTPADSQDKRTEPETSEASRRRSARRCC
jgi:hypothetical protein